MSGVLRSGFEAVGHVDGLDDELVPAHLRLDDEGALLNIPRQEGSTFVRSMYERMARLSEGGVPTSLRFFAVKGQFSLEECQRVGATVSGRGIYLDQIRAPRIVDADYSQDDYSLIDGLATQIDGLSDWAGISTLAYDTNIRDGRHLDITLRGVSGDAIQLGGHANASVTSRLIAVPSTNGQPAGIRDEVSLFTKSGELWPWAEHARVHMMFQDLMCLIYNRRRLCHATHARRRFLDAENPNNELEGSWREVHEPWFGRVAQAEEPSNSWGNSPLFYWKDIDPEALENWIHEYDSWWRPVRIAVTTLFQRGTTFEADLLQSCIALEALGYELWKPGAPPKAKTPNFSSMVKKVIDDIDLPILPDLLEMKTTRWRDKLNASYVGIKHGDKPFPSPSLTYKLHRQCMSLIRAWLGRRLGVTSARLDECARQLEW